MCIVVCKPKGAPFPSWKNLETCFENNPDGAGFAYVRDGKVRMRKGFMTYKELKTAVKKAKLRQSEAVVYHFRIATAGGISKGNTHPFPLFPDRERLVALEYDGNGPVMAHNGVLGKGEHKLSDSQVFVRDIVSDPLIKNNLRENKSIQRLVAEYAGRSKLAFLYRDGEFVTYGKFSEEGGCLYSNDSWKPKKWAFHSSDAWSWSRDDHGTEILVEAPDESLETEEIYYDQFIVCPTCKEDVHLEYDHNYDVWICGNCKEMFDEDGNVYTEYDLAETA